MLEAYEVDLNRHLAALDREESREQAIESQMEESMGVGEAFHPTDALNFIEALEEGNHALLKTALILLESKDFAAGGQLLHQIAHDYWASIARTDAESDVDGECDRCFGRGCRRCDPPEPDHYFD